MINHYIYGVEPAFSTRWHSDRTRPTSPDRSAGASPATEPPDTDPGPTHPQPIVTHRYLEIENEEAPLVPDLTGVTEDVSTMARRDLALAANASASAGDRLRPEGSR